MRLTELLFSLRATMPYRFNNIENRFIRLLKKSIRFCVDILKMRPYLRHKDALILPYVEMPLTVRCTLQCIDCANLIQYYGKTTDESVESQLRYIDRLLTCVDYIHTFTILGGEPLLYKDIATIATYLVQKKQIGYVRITTNGTCLMKEDLLKALQSSKVEVVISDYGNISKRKEELCQQLKNYHISYALFHAKEYWFSFGTIECRKRNICELEQQFATCNSLCRSYYKGKLHLCPRSSHGMDLGIIKKNSSEYVDIMNLEYSPEIIKEEIRTLLQQKSITACNYCDKGTDNFKKIEAAIQKTTLDS